MKKKDILWIAGIHSEEKFAVEVLQALKELGEFTIRCKGYKKTSLKEEYIETIKEEHAEITIVKYEEIKETLRLEQEVSRIVDEHPTYLVIELHSCEAEFQSQEDEEKFKQFLKRIPFPMLAEKETKSGTFYIAIELAPVFSPTQVAKKLIEFKEYFLKREWQKDFLRV